MEQSKVNVIAMLLLVASLCTSSLARADSSQPFVYDSSKYVEIDRIDATLALAIHTAIIATDQREFEYNIEDYTIVVYELKDTLFIAFETKPSSPPRTREFWVQITRDGLTVIGWSLML